MSEKPGLIERYSLAINSTHLELIPHKRGAADLLSDMAMAHGVHGLREPLGGMLMRLIVEFSAVKGEYVAARNHQARQLRMARETKDLALSEQITRDAADSAESAHQYILQKVPSLASTKEQFGRWCLEKAVKQNFMPIGAMPTDQAHFREWRRRMEHRESVVAILAGRVLDVFLEPTCFKCSGRGFSGGYDGHVQQICPIRGGCGGSGKRPINHIGNNREQHDFSYFIYGQIERLLTDVEIQLARKMSDA